MISTASVGTRLSRGAARRTRSNTRAEPDVDPRVEPARITAPGSPLLGPFHRGVRTGPGGGLAAPVFDAMYLMACDLAGIHEPAPDRRRGVRHAASWPPEEEEEPDRSFSTEAVENSVEERVVRVRTVRSTRTGIAICTIAVRGGRRIVSPLCTVRSVNGPTSVCRTGATGPRGMVPGGGGGLSVPLRLDPGTPPPSGRRRSERP